MRYIGSKDRLLPFIEEAWKRHVGKNGLCVGDLFCGTGAVSRMFKVLGNKVVANDNLRMGYVFAQGALNICDEPRFGKLLESGEIERIKSGSICEGPYDAVLAYLNSMAGEEGFFFREYSPGGTEKGEFRRLYFSDENAKKIDAIRKKISLWAERKIIGEEEKCLLLCDLMRATNRIANIAGTYGCFIKHWDPRARKTLGLQRSLITASENVHEVFCTNANNLVERYSFDALYLDPPYNWRHYGAYYHILETIAQEDEPKVSGKTGLRPWEQSKSNYCDRTEAVNALREIVSRAKTEHIFLSYNDEGIISHEQIINVLKSRGEPEWQEVDYRRYRSNNGGAKHAKLKERLYYVKTK